MNEMMADCQVDVCGNPAGLDYESGPQESVSAGHGALAALASPRLHPGGLILVPAYEWPRAYRVHGLERRLVEGAVEQGRSTP